MRSGGLNNLGKYKKRSFLEEVFVEKRRESNANNDF